MPKGRKDFVMKNAKTATTSKKYAFIFDHVNQKIVGKDVDFQKAGIQPIRVGI